MRYRTLDRMFGSSGNAESLLGLGLGWALLLTLTALTVNAQNTPAPELAMPGLEVSVTPVRGHIAKFDLTLDLVEQVGRRDLLDRKPFPA